VGVKCSPIVIASTACGARQSRHLSVIPAVPSVIPALLSVIPAIFLCHSRESGNPSSPLQFHITISHHRKLIILISFNFFFLFLYSLLFFFVFTTNDYSFLHFYPASFLYHSSLITYHCTLSSILFFLVFVFTRYSILFYYTVFIYILHNF